MNTKKIFQNIAFVVAGMAVAVGLSYVAHAATFTVPVGTPPANNTLFPLNVGTVNQVKSGGLSVNAFLANANAELDGSTYFDGEIYADPSLSIKTIKFGGIDPSGIERKVNWNVTGTFSNVGTMTSSPLANKTMSPVCANTSGQIVLCSVTNACSNIPGSTTVPAGDVRNSDGTCSVAPKRFYSSTVSGDKMAENFTSSVVNSQEVYHVNVPKGTPAGGMPLVGTLGLDNDYPLGWQVATIKTVNGTGLDSSKTRLLNVQEKGSYNMKISSQGKVGMKGKFSADANFLGFDFYMKVHTNGADQWIRLDNQAATQGNISGIPHEAYPVAGKTVSDFGGFSGDNTGSNPFIGVAFGGSGDQYSYVPYTFNFQKTMTLNAGDTVDVYAFIYGISTTGDGSIVSGIGNFITGGSFHNSPNNFTYSFESPSTVFDFSEIPG